MPQQTFTGKTLQGSASLGAVRAVLDVETRITAITSPRVRKGHTISGNQALQFAGSYGLMYDGGTGKLVVRWYVIRYTLQDIAEDVTIGATDVFWDLPVGVTATLIVSY